MNVLMHSNLVIHEFHTRLIFYEWLRQYHTDTAGFWLRLYKKGSGKKTIAYNDSVDVALCWGWIDGLINKYDDISLNKSEKYTIAFKIATTVGEEKKKLVIEKIISKLNLI